jgi:adenosylmethionine-8-amino-7-oxononanoate aminotransferase
VFEAFWSDDAGAALMHGPTYMGNALACAAANASLDLFEDGAWRGRRGAGLGGAGRRLEPCRIAPGVVDVRVLGAIGVVEFDQPVAVGALCDAFAAEGAWIRPMGKTVYLTPAFTTPDADLAILLAAIARLWGGRGRQSP